MQASSWKMMPNFRFFRTNPRAVKYKIFRTSVADKTSPSFYETLFKGQLARCGLQPAQALNIDPKNDAVVTPSTLERSCHEAKARGVTLVILVIHQFDRNCYRAFKNIADRKVGIQSVCIVERLRKPDNFFTQYMQNISMKINLKLGGINHTALQPNERYTSMDTMILGADLVHPSTGTIAAVVASVDDVAAKYLGCVRLQPVQDENGPITDREVCTPLLPPGARLT